MYTSEEEVEKILLEVTWEQWPRIYLNLFDVQLVTTYSFILNGTETTTKTQWGSAGPGSVKSLTPNFKVKTVNWSLR